MTSFRLSLFSVLALTACEIDTNELHLAEDLLEDTSARSVWDGTPEGVALLEFLNSEDCTQDVLDYEVPLERRAAGNIIAHRDGGDRLFGTSDDDLYNNVTELDNVRWVGSRTINRMIEYVSSLGLVPHDDDLLGSYDGVSFTVSEANETLDLANRASFSYLDENLDLDRRAASAIVAAQPIETIEHLAGLYFVGKSALTTLKDAAHFSTEDFGSTTQDIRTSGDFNLGIERNFRDPATVDALTQSQLIRGFAAEGMSIQNVFEAFQAMDGDGLYLATIYSRVTGESYDWLRFYSGDTEIGYLFRADKLELVAIIGDGEIYTLD